MTLSHDALDPSAPPTEIAPDNMHRVRAVAVLIERDGLFAGVRSVRRGGAAGLVGGHVEPGELPEDAAVREVREECGLKIRPPRLLGVWIAGGNVCAAYAGQDPGGALRSSAEGPASWMTRAELLGNDAAFPAWNRVALARYDLSRVGPSFNEIPRFPHAQFSINVGWRDLERFVGKEIEDGLDLDPDFQRGHVWTDAQASAYVEYILRGGQSGRDLYFNSPRYTCSKEGPYVIVDGLQRLTAVRRFMRGEIPAFGRPIFEYRDRPDRTIHDFKWHVAELETRAEVLAWYLDFNAGGTPHPAEEIARVRALLDRERSKP